MRKLKLQVQMSVDGFIAGPGGEMDWMVWDWDDALKQNVDELTEPVDLIVLGRKLAAGFIPHWAGVAANPDDPGHLSGKKFTETAKVVFSNTLDSEYVAAQGWQNTEIEGGDLKTRILSLKNQEGGDIIAYGGAEFVSSLIREGLIDEMHLFVNPTLLGKGMPIFEALEEKQALSPLAVTAYACGIVVMVYGKKSD